ncbi:mannose-1-phosphate guanylyltransferase/mannose-6-phosphate isomerase [Aquipseudomonas alcaligenes]|uniref:Alginate biosynthesis protein AlgA n=1 Tax=Aquipseudomonas alcaligenes TaxID=43263 RepID=A0AA37CHI9_AQUAC|nr:mannose-1-phosphate guanylyltransferase/mannose-6-phosphate isomerase [Pseudomonas alcaligenes]BCR22675.1 phosphomannose isomerase/mannose-1-phosphate guanylyl transferase [Pseudomonas alcaligenes]GIZ67956.1 phosphomannose isomerase/mannose-1-phosphate guanylyl transferase [Pseudomonas alcaligenes]GIZ72471.1 phosphomannose isomerase/mannose-1-phosphate guanylyl transferase [Pseudomonas alcaligenes]GIZ76812.1 phosphomannose isomerase/mannose-1-phosphate guanylyl transferase [Pseudomonas alcal
MIVPVILSGGAGTRLWPVSREDHPKPFMRLPDGQSLLLKTYVRAANLLPSGGEIVTVTNREHYFESKDHFTEAKLSGCRSRFILEPQGRNTAPALAVAALALAADYGEDAVLVVMAADHLIQDLSGFAAATEHAVQLAKNGYLVTYGVQPAAPETGFGYIEVGDALDEQGGSRVKRFVEKPDSDTAQHYLESGRFLWNSGMFCFLAGTLIRELQEHAPELLERARVCVGGSAAQNVSGGVLQELHGKHFAELPDISIDYALMEHSRQVAVVPAQFDWSDIGSWTALRDLVSADTDHNRVQGDALFIDSRNTYVQSQNRLVATVGVDDLIVVETDDAVLVAHASCAQQVGQVAKRLKLENHEAYRLHRTVSRPWGTYTVLEEGARFKIKRIVVKPGRALSLQMHHHRSEHWIVVQGMAKVVNGTTTQLINSNESTFIPAGHRHRLENPGVIDLVMIEVQSGEYLGEDDIVRFEDNYGRAPV